LLGLDFGDRFFEEVGDVEACGPGAGVFQIEIGVDCDNACDVAPLTVGDLTANSIPLQLGQQYIFSAGHGVLSLNTQEQERNS